MAGDEIDNDVRDSNVDTTAGQAVMDDDVDRGIIVNANDMPDDMPTMKKKKKKNSKRPASKRGLDKPTGFEEFHADGPLTPEQYLEAKELFHPDVPFIERILKGVQQFERTRKLFPERRNVFYKYLAYGGLDVGPKMFVGGQDTDGMQKDELIDTLAQTSLSEAKKREIIDPKQEDKNNVNGETLILGDKMRIPEYQAKYVVDFEGTMRSFLSRQAWSIFVFDTEESVSFVTITLERFMDYLLQHDVCPEYTGEVLRTRDLCREAKKELWKCVQAQQNMPGDFNKACSTLFGGSYAYDFGNETDATGGQVPGCFTQEQATQIIGFAVAGAASEEVYAKYLEITAGESEGQGFKVIKTIHNHCFEITRLKRPTKDCVVLYKENSSDFKPVGNVLAKFFRNPNAAPEDLTADERAAGVIANDDYETDTYDFFIESDPLFEVLRPGMRVQATIYKLNCGIWFFDEVIRAYPTFDLWLENELVLDWKDPKPVPGVHHSIWNVGGDNNTNTELTVTAGVKSDEVSAVIQMNDATDTNSVSRGEISSTADGDQEGQTVSTMNGAVNEPSNNNNLDDSDEHPY